MIRWTLRIGVAFIAAGLFLLSPVADFLPVDLWPWVQDLFSETPSQYAYLRVESGPVGRIVEFSLMGIGLALVAAALYLRSRE
jgi:hypothetical protein